MNSSVARFTATLSGVGTLMTDTWFADLMTATAEWVRDCGGTFDVGGVVASMSGAAHELEFYGDVR